VRRPMAESLIQQILDALSAGLNDDINLTWTPPAGLKAEMSDRSSGTFTGTAFRIRKQRWLWQPATISAEDVAERMTYCLRFLTEWGESSHRQIWLAPLVNPIRASAAVQGDLVRCWLTDGAGARLDIPEVDVSR
jgi:hypothetical protein